MTTLRGLGWLPDVPKPNDYTSDHPQVAPLLEKTKLPQRVRRAVSGKDGSLAKEAGAMNAQAKVDLRASFSPVEDQGHLGSCTANAAIGLLEYFERKASGRFVDASRLFLYKVERDLLGLIGDTGAYLRTAMEALTLFGAPPERYWPYDGSPPTSNTRYDLEPTPFCYAFGERFRAIKYYRLDPAGVSPSQILANIKAMAAAGFPSMFGFPVYTEYDNPLPGAKIAFPGAGSHYRGGHANVVAGYDDDLMIGSDKGALLVRNSWGTGWGDAGYAWLSYRYVTDGLATDWWSMISSSWVDVGVF
jgi:C1A family cysteine protease